MTFLFQMFVSFAVVFAVVSGKGTAKGKFEYKNAQCKWHEKRETRSMRSLNIECGGNNAFKTSYEGDPHKCNWYLKGNQVQYYECLVSALKKANFCSNSPSQIACDKKSCGDVIFKKMGSRLYRLLMKVTEREEDIFETEDPDWNEFRPLAGFN